MPNVPPLRVATFNLLHGRRWPRGGAYRKAALEAAIASLNADVLALQEVDRRVIRTWFADQARISARAGGSRMHVFAGAQWLPFGAMGNALCVRGDIADAQILWHPTSLGRERRNAILARIACGDAEMTVAATHLQNHRTEAEAGLRFTLDALMKRPGPHVLLGDLNLSTHRCAPILAEYGLELLDTHRLDGRVITHDNAPRIDHIAVNGIGGIEVPVEKPPISDHAPILAELSPLG